MNAEALAVLRTRQNMPVPLAGVRATGRLNGLLFELDVEQRYENRSDTNIEAVYTFPVPLHAAFLGLEIEIGARRLFARAKRTDQARREYETAIDEGNTAVLLEQADDGLYTVSLGNLLAGETAVIRYRYAELLDVAQGAARLRIPTVIAPRYGDASRRVQPHQEPGVDLTAEYPFELKIIVDGMLANVPLTSPTHRIHTSCEGTAALVTLAAGARLDRDFVLAAELRDFKGAAVTARDGDGYVSLVSWVPALPGPEDTPLALKVLIDCSGSMGGDSIAQARRALAAIVDGLRSSGPRGTRRNEWSAAASPWKQAIERLNSLRPGSRVSAGAGCCGPGEPDSGSGCRDVPRAPDAIALTRFGSCVDRITAGLQPATPELVAQLREVARRLQADLGGTELPGALRDVLSQPTNGAPNPAVLLITDGEIWAIDQALAAVAAAGHRLFVVAVGAAPNEALARRVAEVTGGACEFVTPGENIEQAIVRMARRVREPVYRLSEVRWPIPPDWAAPLPTAVFSGDTVHLLAGFRDWPGDPCAIGPCPPDFDPVNGRLLSLAGSATVGVIDSRDRVVATELLPLARTVSDADTLVRVAAARRIAAMDGEAAAALAEQHQLASPWTAFVVVDEREVKAGALPELATVPQMPAAGWGGAGSVSVPSCIDLDLGPDAFETSMKVGRDSRAVRAGLMPVDAARPPGRGLLRSVTEGNRPPSARRAIAPATRSAAAVPPLAVAERILADVGRGDGGPGDLQELADLGVPQAVCDELREAAALHGVDEHIVVELWAALLVEQLREHLVDATLLATPTVQHFMAILGDRALRELRGELQRRVIGVAHDHW